MHIPLRYLAAMLILSGSLFTGCRTTEQAEIDYARPLPEGAWALRKIHNPDDWPDLRRAFNTADETLQTAAERSLDWFTRPSSQKHFPIYDITHLRARTSVWAFHQLLRDSPDASSFLAAMRAQFDVYESVGYNGKGGVLFTGYYAPEFPGSLERTERFAYPLYTRPDDLMSDPLTGEILGRQVGNSIEPYPGRSELENSDMLAGLEIVWLESRFDQYVVQVNGSAKINLHNGDTLYLGYAGSNGKPYTSIGQILIDQGFMTESELNLPRLRQYARENPEAFQQIIENNERFVFFQEYPEETWPTGSINVKVTPMRTLATDKSIFPRASVMLVQTQIPTMTATGSEQQSWTQFMLDQDTGGAIRAPGRADIYMGQGRAAEVRAGRQMAEGRMYYLMLKHEHVLDWHEKMNNASQADISAN